MALPLSDYPQPDDLVVKISQHCARYALRTGFWATVYDTHVQGFYSPRRHSLDIGIGAVCGDPVPHDGTPTGIEAAVREVLAQDVRNRK